MAEVKKERQTMRFNDLELSLLKNSFTDAVDLIRAIRKGFLQLELGAVDLALLETLKGQPELLAVIRKSCLPQLDGNAPLHQVVDLWMTVEIKDKPYEDAYPHLCARATLIDYIEQQLQFLEGKKTNEQCEIRLEGLVFDSTKTPEKGYSDLIARNTLIGHIEMQLNQFTVLASLESETLEDTKKRLQKDGNQ